MARKKSPVNAGTVNLQISGNTGGNESEIEPVSPEAADIDAALDALPEGSIAILRRMEPNGDRAFIEQTAPSAMDESRIATHGAGTYIVQFRGPLGDGTARIGYKGQRRVVIGESAARAALAKVAAAPAAAAAPSSGGGIMDQLASGMLLGIVQQMQQMSAMQATQMREHSTAMMALLGKLGERPATDPILTTLLTNMLDKRVDPIEQATKIAEIASKGSGTKASTGEVLAALELVEKIREMGGGETRSSEGWTGMLQKLAPMILGQANQQPPVAVVPPNAALPAGTQTTTESAMPDNYLAPISPFFPRILESAQVGHAPEIAADFFVGFIPVGHYPILLGILDRPTVVPDIVQHSPALKPYEQWLTALVAEMRKALAGDDDDDAGGGG